MPDKVSIGGPGIVPVIHAAQVLRGTNCSFSFFGYGGNDEDGNFLISALGRTPVNLSHYKLVNKPVSGTIVFSDPNYDNGNGERIFINTIGAAGNYTPEELDEDFFTSDILVFGGTALVPKIHDDLTGLLEKAKSKNCITIVNTVYDFRNEKADQTKKWPLGKSDTSYQNIDLLITDFEEALRLSGKQSIDESIQFFKQQGSKAVLVTNGVNSFRVFSGSGSLFKEWGDWEMPVSSAITEDLKKAYTGDTTGCGDNFAGGVIASLVSQLQKGKSPLNITEACSWGIVSGGYACFYIGGTFFEQYPGEKRQLISPYYEQYKKQVSYGE